MQTALQVWKGCQTGLEGGIRQENGHSCSRQLRGFTCEEPEEMSRVVKELHGTTVGDGDVVEEIRANSQQFMPPVTAC